LQYPCINTPARVKVSELGNNELVGTQGALQIESQIPWDVRHIVRLGHLVIVLKESTGLTKGERQNAAMQAH
jgi:hypothetical protein